MKLIIDDANVEVIKRLLDYYPISGVTTNPSILAKVGRSPFDVLREIRSVIGPDAQLHAQAVSSNAAGMVEEAHKIVKELGENTYVKIPAIEEGFKAMKIIHSEGINITATVVYSPMQGYLAGLAGAQYAAPYVNRIDNLGYDGVKVACDIHDIYIANNIPCQVLGASFKTSQQVLALCKHGIGAATVSPDVLSNLTMNAAVDSAVAAFVMDFEKLTGSGKTMIDC